MNAKATVEYQNCRRVGVHNVKVTCHAQRANESHKFIPVSVDGKHVGTVYRVTDKCPWQYDRDLCAAYPEFENLVTSSATHEALDLVRHTIYRKHAGREIIDLVAFSSTFSFRDGKCVWGEVQYVFVDGVQVGYVFRHSPHDTWSCDSKLLNSFPSLQSMPRVFAVDTMQETVSDAIKHSINIHEKGEGDMATEAYPQMAEQERKMRETMRGHARKLSEEVIEEAKNGHTHRAATKSKQLRVMTMDLIDLSEEINKIYKSTIDYAEAVGMVDVEALKRDPS